MKTWLRANLKQQRFNNVALLHTHKDICLDGLLSLRESMLVLVRGTIKRGTA